MVAPALVNRAPFEQTHDRDERRVEDRHGEDEDRQQERCGGRARHLVARQEPEAGDGEAEHLRAGVAHERLGRPAQAQVEAQEADARKCQREREHEHRVVRVDGDGVEREVAGRDRGERGREPVHVVEQVERVRHPDEPDHTQRHRDPVAPDDLDRQAAPQRDRSCAELRPELRPGGKRVQVVDEPREEEHRAADQHAPQLRARLERTGRERDEGTGEQPGEDPEPADERGLLLVPAIGARRSGEAAEDGGTERRPDHRVRGSQGGDRSERDHERKG